MKKIYFLMFAITSLTACHKADNQPGISYDMPYSQTQAIVLEPANNEPMSDAGANLTLPPVTVPTYSKAYFDKYHTDSKHLASTYLAGINLQIPTPGTHNFDFADELDMYISGNGQPEILVASYNNTSAGLKSINLNLVPGINLKNYFAGDSITVRIGIHVNFIPAVGAQLVSSGMFQFAANPL